MELVAEDVTFEPGSTFELSELDLIGDMLEDVLRSRRLQSIFGSAISIFMFSFDFSADESGQNELSIFSLSSLFIESCLCLSWWASYGPIIRGGFLQNTKSMSQKLRK